MSTMTTARLAATPRVNLLPPEIAQREAFRRFQGVLGLAVVAAAGVVAALYVTGAHQVSSAQHSLDSSTARGSALTRQTATYNFVRPALAQRDAAEAELSQAMGQEVQWSYFLNDLSLSLPPHVWLSSMMVSRVQGAGAAPGATGTDTGIATVSFTGHALSHDDVATWLESLARQKGYANPYFTESTLATEGAKASVTFQSTVQVTGAALSNRYAPKAGD